jgi:putative ABC transport system substrate-binding protein
VAIEYRWAEGQYERLPKLASELVNRKVAVLAAVGGSASIMAAKGATSSIPIVFPGSADVEKLGVIASLNHPGGNATGVSTSGALASGKRLQVLHDLLPAAQRVFYLSNPKFPTAQAVIAEIQAAAVLGTRIHIVEASSEREIDAAFVAMRKARASAFLLAPDAFFINRRDQIVALAAHHAIPACYPFREFVEAGGLASYGADLVDVSRQAGLQTARILKGANPAELPVIQATKFELIVNLKTAKHLGLAISRDFLARVDEVIQ